MCVYCKDILTFYLFELLYKIASEDIGFARQNAGNIENDSSQMA